MLVLSKMLTELESAGKTIEHFIESSAENPESTTTDSDTRPVTDNLVPPSNPTVVFQAARKAALDSNLSVDQLKKELEAANQVVASISDKLKAALENSSNLHQLAIEAAKLAQAAMESELMKIKESIDSHTRDMITQNGLLDKTK